MSILGRLFGGQASKATSESTKPTSAETPGVSANQAGPELSPLAQALVTVYTEAQDKLLSHLGASSSSRRDEIGGALAAFRKTGDGSRLMQVLSDEEMRSAAVSGVGDAGDHRALGALQLSLEDPSGTVRMNAAYALGKIKDPSSVDLLVEHFSDTNRGMDGAVISALEAIGDPRARPALIRRLKSGNDTSGMWSASVLAGMPNDEVVAALIDALDSWSLGVQAAAAKALLRIGDSAVSALEAKIRPDASPGASEREVFEKAARRISRFPDDQYDPNIDNQQLLRDALAKLSRA